MPFTFKPNRRISFFFKMLYFDAIINQQSPIPIKSVLFTESQEIQIKSKYIMTTKFCSKLLLSILVLLCLKAEALSQSYNWIIPNKAYLKLSVVDDAMYRITRTDFTGAGVNTTTIDPRTVRVFNRGQEIPIHFEGQSDGVFDASDYFDFYGMRNTGGPTKYFNQDNQLIYTKDEYYNLYSDTNVYWVEWGVATGQRFTNPAFSTTDDYQPDYYWDKIQCERDRVYTMGERIDGNDFRNFSNENFQGEGWYWSQMTTNQFVSDTFSVKTLSPQVLNAGIKLFAYPGNRSLSINNEHSIIVQVNSTYLTQMYRNDFNRFDTVQSFPTSLLSSTNVNTIRVFYQSNASFSGNLYFDFFQVQVPKAFRFNSNIISANLGGSDTTSKRFRISGYVPANQTNIYDVVNNVRITNFTFSADTLILTAKSNARLEIHNRTIVKKPFRIIQRQVSGLASASNGADYIIVHHQNFAQPVSQLKNHRETYDNFRVLTADIRDVYDIFNYGIENPVAVRNFFKHAYDNYVQPRVKYACLFGRSSTDPKKNSIATVYSQNLVPTYGNPTTDSYFANFNYGSYFYYPMINVGRLPALTLAEATAMVENIITYEISEPGQWLKVNTFIVGGGTAADQQTFQAIDTAIINNYALPPPLSADVHKIFRNDTMTTVTFNYKDSIRRDINNGAAIVNFLGHAGYENWEEGMQDPGTLANYGKFPFVLSMTCYTGKSSDPEKRTFGEQWVNMLNRGSVGFIGCSGWGWVLSQTTMQKRMYQAVAFDTVRRFGEILRLGKSSLLQDSSSSTVRHTVNSYGLLGDPAGKLNVPVAPEYSIANSDCSLSNTFPELNQSLTITAIARNIGLSADSCKIRFQLKSNGHVLNTRDTLLKPFRFVDTVRYSFRPDSLKDYAVLITLDPEVWNPNELRYNNFADIQIPLKEYSFVPLKPANHAVMKTDSVEFTGINPIANFSSKNVKVLLELDTTQNFNSGIKRSFVKNNATGYVTKFKTLLPVINTNVIYYWRTNAVINSDSSGWTTPQAFSYNPFLYSVSAMEPSGVDSPIQPDTGIVVFRKKDKGQFPSGDLNNTVYSNGGIILKSEPLKLQVRSMGSSGAEASYFSVNYQNINIDGGRSPGLSMLKVRKLNGTMLEYRNFRMTSGQSSDSVINFLNTFDSSHYLMALNASYVAGAVAMNNSAKNKIKTFGCTKIDSFSVFGWFDSWSFIGYLGAPQSAVSEMVKKYTGSTGWQESNSLINSTIYKTNGSVVNYFGPAQKWTEFSWTPVVNPNTSILFDVIGIDRFGGTSTLMSNQSGNNGVDLSGINALQYPSLYLVGKLAIDSLTGNISPVLSSVNAKYAPAAEIMIDKYSITKSDTVVKVGDDIKVRFNFANIGYVNVPGIVMRAYHTAVNPANLISVDSLMNPFKTDTAASGEIKFKVPYVRPYGNYAKFFVEISPAGGLSDFYNYNNSSEFYLTLKLPGVMTMIDVYSDGQIVRSGDYVRRNPEIRVDLRSQELEAMQTTDTSRLKIFVNGISLSSVTSPVAKSISSSDKIQLVQDSDIKSGGIFKPDLRQGNNLIRVEFTDASGERNSVELNLIVSDEMLIKDLYNFPNPMRNETSFTFNITGEENPGECKVRIYTSSGRLIKEIRHEAVLGFNRVSWDGRDDDGDLVANGVYLYKLVTEGDGQTETATQKLVILR